MTIQNPRLKSVTRFFFLPLIFGVALVACSKAPITGRSQLHLVPDSEMIAMADQQYDDFLKQNKISTDQAATDQVKRVGGRIANAVETYLTQHNMADEVKKYSWEFNLVESKDVNAWCMPGGKVVVYTGILPVTKDDTGLAVVLGHEIAHAVANHGSERMSQGLLQQMGGVALSTALAKSPAATQQLAMTAYGVGSQYGAILPFGRTQESEADHLGLIFMAMAGYNPDEAVTFWERMAASAGEKPPEILSTHPSDQHRIDDIKKLLPEAHKYYKPAGE